MTPGGRDDLESDGEDDRELAEEEADDERRLQEDRPPHWDNPAS